MAFSVRAGTNWCHDFPKLARESGFRFNRHGPRIRVDWKRISSIDIDRVICERDLSAIDENVNNIVDCCLESEYDVKILDPNFVKLFRLAQLSIEYLLYCKQYLDHSVVILKDELRAKIEENAKLNGRVRDTEDSIKELKDRLKERHRSTDAKLSDSHGEIHKCPQCPKTFISSVFMNAHVNRRHPSSNTNFSHSSSPVLDERYRAEAEKLHNEIKTLKERLNLTERLIRKESDKRPLSGENEARVKSDESPRFEEESKKENRESRREYQEELKSFKETLFSEIRQQNLKLDRLSVGRDAGDDNAGGNAKELIRQQENEIQRLRDQLYKRLAPDVEDIQTKLNHQEDLWLSRIENLERRHRADIEKLYEQLKITRESADQMRVDYIAKIDHLERETRERQEKAKRLSDRDVQTEKRFLPTERNGNRTISRNFEGSGDSTDEIIRLPVESHSKNRPISGKDDCEKEERAGNFTRVESVKGGKIIDSENESAGGSSIDTTNLPNPSHEDRNKTSRKKLIAQKSFSSPFNEPRESLTNGFGGKRLSIDESRQDTRRNSGSSGAKAETGEDRVKESFAKSPKVQKIATRQINKSDREKSESSDSESESEASSSIDSSSGSESDSESESLDVSEAIEEPQRKNTNEKRPSRVEVKSNDLNEPFNRAGSEKPVRKDMIEELNSKLRDLGVDPDWQGIPKATMRQIMETVKHHRNLSCKKYRKLDEIRRDLLEQVNEKSASRAKLFCSVEERNADSRLERLLTNVKGGKAWKALSILEKNDGSHKSVAATGKKAATRRRSVSTEKPTGRDVGSNVNKIIEDEHVLRRVVNLKSPREQTSGSGKSEESQMSKRASRIVVNNSNNERKQLENSSNDSPGDLKYLSHSYESIKSFRQYEGAINSRRKINVTGAIVTSSPQRRGSDSIFNFANDASAIKHNEEEVEDFSSSPINGAVNKSVIKSANRGSSASLVKKKVVFDLENRARDSPDNLADKDNNRADATKDSESDCEISSINEEITEKEDGDEKPSGNIAFKTFQSEKIARISKQIEQQLSVARRKPVGSVEAMFADKLSSTRTDETFAILEAHADLKSPIRDAHPQAAPRAMRNWSSELPKNSSNANFGSKESNLDKDIDELLEIE